ncbi:MAG: hypothetical protein ACRDL0_05750 [Thermoleophilaceae bacterium]
MPLRHLRGRLVTLDDCFGPAGGLVRAQLLESRGWAARLAIVDSFLLGRLARADPPPPSLAWARPGTVLVWGRIATPGQAAPEVAATVRGYRNAQLHATGGRLPDAGAW